MNELHLSLNELVLVDRIISWAYDESLANPRTSIGAYRKAVKQAIQKLGYDRISREFSKAVNGVRFLAYLDMLLVLK